MPTGVAGLFEAVDVRDVGMIQRSQQLSFTLKPRETFRIGPIAPSPSGERTSYAPMRVPGVIAIKRADYSGIAGAWPRLYTMNVRLNSITTAPF